MMFIQVRKFERTKDGPSPQVWWRWRIVVDDGDQAFVVHKGGTNQPTMRRARQAARDYLELAASAAMEDQELWQDAGGV